MKGLQQLLFPWFWVAAPVPGQRVKEATTKDHKKEFVSVDGTKFRDPMGREMILNGINLIDKDSARGYTCAIPESDFVKVREWGVNI